MANEKEGKPPAFQMYARDWIAGTLMMSHEEKGAYMDLLCVQWDNGPLPDDPVEIARALGGAKAYKKLWPRLQAKFPPLPDGRRANAKLERIRAIQALRRDAGSKGGSKTQANGEANEAAKSKPASASAFASASENDSSVVASSLVGGDRPKAVRLRERTNETPGSERRREGQGMSHIGDELAKYAEIKAS